MLEGIKKFVKHVVAKLISAGGTITLTVGTYTFTIVFSETTGLKLTPESVDALIKALISLAAGYSTWKYGVIENIKAGYETKARFEKEKSAFDLL